MRAYYLIFLLTLSQGLMAQDVPLKDWFLLDLKQDKYPGISSDKAYSQVLKDKVRVPVIVAVIDGGTDTAHEDLIHSLWTNTGEIAGNGIDDDHNGYIDDIHGWSFIGGKDSDVVEESLEVTRIYGQLRKQYGGINIDTSTADKKREYQLFSEVRARYRNQLEMSTDRIELYANLFDAIDEIRTKTGKDNPSIKELKEIKTDDKRLKYTISLFNQLMSKDVSFSSLVDQIKADDEQQRKNIRYSYNASFDARVTVGDDPENYSQRYYGNNHICGPKGEHGTHVAGIIAADRTNKKGIKGIADQARVMVLRIVPDGDERDKDVANAIRYAADNGAKVINMSFGKSYSPGREYVDAAVRYAVSKDVLLVHAAGNDAAYTAEADNFPRACREGNDSCTMSWIEVGASSWKKKKELAADFSNYGASNVDVFAPGVAIYSTLPNNTYASYNGTSMASPVVAGIAVLIRSTYPQLKAWQVKHAIVASVTPVKRKVIKPGTKKDKVKMKTLCSSGGIVNAYEALIIAGRLAADSKQ